MAFLRTKRVKGINYLYRVESYRQGTRVRQRVLEYLGRAAAKDAQGSKRDKKGKRDAAKSKGKTRVWKGKGGAPQKKKHGKRTARGN